MKFFSFVREGCSLKPVEIQVNLLPGLPEVRFSGLVDTGIKESITRLKSSFRSMGYKWPRQQMLINLSPANIKKSSLGMDLALSTAILHKTSQLKLDFFPNKSQIFMYGELDLHGNVTAPRDWMSLPLNAEDCLITGALNNKNYRDNNYLVTSLKDLKKPSKMLVEDWTQELKKPELPDIYFSKEASLILQAVAVGEHNILLCGESGSGKTTLAENLYYLLQTPRKKTWQEARLLNYNLEKQTSWRPCLSPHHSTTALSMIGGGSPLFLGEISKAHGGLLIMDEFLEFHPKVQEALREPVEKGHIRLVRRGQTETFPAEFLLVATSNLCPCGDYLPEKPISCSYSLRRCQSHLQRLSGPMLDRFSLLTFSNQWKGEKTESLRDIHQKILKASYFRKQKRKQELLNDKMPFKDLKTMVDQKTLDYLPENISQRRTQSLLRVARTFSDLEGVEEISHSAIQKSFQYTIKNFYLIKNGMLNS